MTTEQMVAAAAGAVALVAVVVAVLALRSASRALDRVAELQAGEEVSKPSPEAAAGHARQHDSEADEPYVITAMTAMTDRDVEVASVPERIDGRLFVDIVARETLVKAASWGHGLRRALAPEMRNRIRFEVRQQARQSRRDRRTEMREALRHYRARRRVSPDEDAA